jgi:hypothetical protein
MFRTAKQRMAVLVLLATLFLAAYTAGTRYSPAIVAYVVRQTLIQKAPAGVDPGSVGERFDKLFAPMPSDAKMEKMLALSSYLEKVQKLSPEELKRLLATAEGTERPGM